MNNITIILLLLLASCSQKEQKNTIELIQNKSVNSLQKEVGIAPPIIYKTLKKLTLIGDFNGDGKTETLFQTNINSKTGIGLDSFPDPFKNEWDSVIDFLYKKNSEVIIKIPYKNSDTLFLGTGIGLYCLINIGDNNNDKKDEIAFVVDRVDYSMTNHCHIYSLCGEKWIELKSININEEAFFIYEGVVKNKNIIKNYLEKKKGKWMYLDYLDDIEYDKEEYVGKMKPLKIKKCN